MRRRHWSMRQTDENELSTNRVLQTSQHAIGKNFPLRQREVMINFKEINSQLTAPIPAAIETGSQP